MSNLNLTISGIAVITSDPKIIESSTGTPCLVVPVGAREFYMDKNGSPQTTITYIDLEFWTTSENIKLLTFEKGDTVEFKGKLNEAHWENKDTLEKRKKHFVKVKNLKKLEE
jgi:single-stranded DNA-binding protein